ncbi:MAG: hypothetical protein ACQESU_03205 [Halobacteriota archaeon]
MPNIIMKLPQKYNTFLWVLLDIKSLPFAVEEDTVTRKPRSAIQCPITNATITIAPIRYS